MASQSHLPALKTNPKAIFFTDFDGTITIQDSNDFMTDNLGFGADQRKALNKEVLADKLDFRDAFWQMMDSVPTPFNECIPYLVKNIELDPGFKSFLTYATKSNIPVVILSGGMTPIIRALLVHLVGEKEMNDIEIISNNVGAKPGKSIDEKDGWEIVFHDDSGFGHDKSLAIRPYAELPSEKRPTLFYAGDGVSDLSAAKETDLLFAKQGRDLVDYCVKEDVPFTEFNDWSDILAQVQEIMDGKSSVKDAASTGYQRFKDAQKRGRVNLEPQQRESGHTTPIVPGQSGFSKPS